MLKPTFSPERCSKMIWSGFYSNQCKRMGKNIEDGKLWCKQHTPSIRKARQDASHSEWDARNEEARQRMNTKHQLVVAVLYANLLDLPPSVRVAVRHYRTAHD